MAGGTPAQKGGRRVLLGAPGGLDHPENGAIPPFFDRAVRGRGAKDTRRPPFRAAGTITMNRDTSPAKESRGRLRAVPDRLGRGSHRRQLQEQKKLYLLQKLVMF